MKLYQLLALTFYACVWCINCEKTISIGGILSNNIHRDIFLKAISNLTAPAGYNYNGVPILIGSNPVVTANDICNNLLPQKVVTVIFDVPLSQDRFMSCVPYTMEFYKIPVVGVSSQSSVLSNTYAHPLFMRTLPPHSFQSGLWYNTLTVLKYNKVIFIYTNDVEGETTLDTFRNMIDESKTEYGEKSLEISKLIMLQPYETNFTLDLLPIQAEDSRVILLAVGSDIAENVYKAAAKLELLRESWVWIVSDEASNVSNVPQGALRWQPSIEVTSIESNIRDALRVINEGIKEYLSNNTDMWDDLPDSCGGAVLGPPTKDPWSFTPSWWQPGINLYNLYKSITIFDGYTGLINFKDNGDRRSVTYDLVNTHNNSESLVGNFTTFYNTTSSMIEDLLDIVVDDIVWPGYPESKPEGVNVSKHLRVVTIQETPFVYTMPLDISNGCNDTQLNDPSAVAKMKCPKYLENGTVLEFCCYGYLIDMLDMLRINMSVTFDVHLVADDSYGAQHTVSNMSGKAQWTGMMGELLEGKADMIVAPFVINPERAKYVDFTKPFKFLGITILVKKNAQKSSLDSFLQPFQKTLWFLVVVSVHVIALVLYLLDRFSPFGQLQLARETDSEDALSLSTAIWFAWGVLLNSGIGEGTPKSFSARVLGMVWAGFAMIIVASYTANLAAFLVLDKPEASISGIDDPRLRNPTDNFKFATVKDSAIEDYFKRQVEFTTMYRTMKTYNKDTVEEAIKAVDDGDLHAFIWDSPRLIYEATQECDLVTAGELFGRSSYGIAFKKNSHWTDLFSLRILSYHEVGKMEKYDNKWIMNATDCDPNVSSPATLGLTNMAGVFIMVAIGIGIGFVILLIEIGYSKYENMKEKQNTIAKKAVSRWKRYVQRRKALRKTWALIKDINETECISDEERRRRIRDYLESPSVDAQSASLQANHNNGTAVVSNGRQRASVVTSANWSEDMAQASSSRNVNGVNREPSSLPEGTSSTSIEVPPYLHTDGSVKYNPVFIDNV